MVFPLEKYHELVKIRDDFNDSIKETTGSYEDYLFHGAGYAGGLTVLLDKDGKPVITKEDRY